MTINGDQEASFLKLQQLVEKLSPYRAVAIGWVPLLKDGVRHHLASSFVDVIDLQGPLAEGCVPGQGSLFKACRWSDGRTICENYPSSQRFGWSFVDVVSGRKELWKLRASL